MYERIENGRGNNWPCVLPDLKLGSHEGLDVLRSIRTKYPTKPVELVTGHKEEMGTSIEKGMEIGALAFMDNFLCADALIKSIEEMTNMKRCAVLGRNIRRGEPGP